MDQKTVEALVSAIATPRVTTIDVEHAYALLPPGHSIEDVRSMLPPPPRIQQKVNLCTVQSFLAYVTRFAEATSVVFADEPNAKYEAVIDYHWEPIEEDDSATGSVDFNHRGACDHVALYSCPKSPQWIAWTSGSGKYLGQIDFAGFLEANIPDILEPSGASLLELALHLQVHKDAKFQSEVRLENGQNRFRYDETIRGTAKAGDIEIPKSFALAIPVFLGGAVFRVEARFRYRMTEGTLLLGYELIRPLDVYNAAIAKVTEEIRTGLKDTALYVGARG